MGMMLEKLLAPDGEPWSIAKDVCYILGYTNSSKAIKDHVDDEDKLNNESLLSLGQRGAWLLSESGLYSLVLRSKKPEAKEFTRWVTKEVLPSIRKHGAYMTTSIIEDVIDNPDLLIKLATTLKEERSKNEQLQIENNILLPKAQFYDDVTGSNDAVEMKDVAKVINCGLGRNSLFEYLRKKKVLMRDNTPYQKFVDAEWFRVVESKYTNKATGDIHINIKTLVYQKGMDSIIKVLRKDGFMGDE